MDPVSAVANAVSMITGVIGMNTRRASRPDRINPLDYQERWTTSDILLTGMIVVLTVVIAAVAITSFKKK